MFANIPVYLYKNNPNKNWSGKVGNCEEPKYINIIQGETGSETLNFHLFLDDSTPLDLADRTVTFYFTKPDGTELFLQANIPQESAANGIAIVTLTAQCTSVSGLTRNGVIRVTDTNNSVLKFPVPSMYIAASDCEETIESSSEFHALDIALNSASKSLTAAQEAAENARNVLESDRQTLANIEATLAAASSASDAANTAAGTANDKATAADQAAQSANSAAAAATGAANMANNAAQACNDALSDMSTVAKTEVDKHALLTNNPHNVTAAQLGAATTTVSIQNLSPLCGLQKTGNNICKVAKTNLLKFVSAELKSTVSINGWTQILSLPPSSSGSFPTVIYVNNTVTPAWFYADGTFKTLSTIPQDATVIVNFMYI